MALRGVVAAGAVAAAYAGVSVMSEGLGPETSDCSSYTDDDVTYTAETCGQADTNACTHCGHGWCEYFCGANSTLTSTACGDGGGAVCAMDRLSNLTETCAIVDAVKADDYDTWTYNEGQSNSVLSAVADLYSENLGGALVQGCDMHVYCEFCGTECQSAFDLAATVLGSSYTKWADKGHGPLSFQLLLDISTLCDLYNEGDINTTASAVNLNLAAAAATAAASTKTFTTSRSTERGTSESYVMVMGAAALVVGGVVATYRRARATATGGAASGVRYAPI